MTTPKNPIHRDPYVATVLQWYVELPQSPSRARPPDYACAREFARRRVTLETVESALLLGSVRRLGRPPDYPPLQPIRSLAYFSPIVDELIEAPVPHGYLQYLRQKVRTLSRKGSERKCG